MTKRVYIDIYGVLCYERFTYLKAKQDHQEIEFLSKHPGIFQNLKPMPNAVEIVEHLRNVADAYILSAPSS